MVLDDALSTPRPMAAPMPSTMRTSRNLLPHAQDERPRPRRRGRRRGRRRTEGETGGVAAGDEGRDGKRQVAEHLTGIGGDEQVQVGDEAELVADEGAERLVDGLGPARDEHHEPGEKATTYTPSPTMRTAMAAGITRIRRKRTAARCSGVAGGRPAGPGPRGLPRRRTAGNGRSGGTRTPRSAGSPAGRPSRWSARTRGRAP